MSFGLLAACESGKDARAEEDRTVVRPAPAKSPSAKTRRAEAQLGVTDKGIWGDLDSRVTLPAPTIRSRGQAVLDSEHKLLIIYDGDVPLKAYPVGGPAEIRLGATSIALRRGDAAELAPLRTRLDLVKLAKGAEPPGGDADGDGLPNSLDILIGARKTVLNGASYGAGYIRLEYPNGDVPRDVGVCSDVVIRAVRNAGVDLQSALHKDIRKAKRSYPMVKKRNSHIDHRRVKTLLPFFKRHWDERKNAIDSASDPLVPGDVVFMDTFPNRRGPDHIGIVSANKAANGNPLIINNWTDGTVTTEMDLLDFVPVTHRFRMK